MRIRYSLSTLATFIIFFTTQPARAVNTQPADIRVMGIGIYSCEYWHDKVFRIAINSRALQKEASFYPYASLEEWNEEVNGNSESKRLFREASDWASGYFAAAQRYGRKTAINPKQTTDIVLDRIFDICQQYPTLKFEEAAWQALSEFLK